MINVGDTVRVLAFGQFKGQIVKVLARKEKKLKIEYRLDTTWDGKPYPAWFDHEEVEKMKKPTEAHPEGK
jgi:hypothetical protein